MLFLHCHAGRLPTLGEPAMSRTLLQLTARPLGPLDQKRVSEGGQEKESAILAEICGADIDELAT